MRNSIFLSLLLLQFTTGLYGQLIPQPSVVSDCSEVFLSKLTTAESQHHFLVRNTRASHIDSSLAAKRFSRYASFSNWIPLSAEKRVLCGLVGHQNVHKSGKEKDHNLRIIPNDSFQYLIKDAEYRREKDKEGFNNWHDCNGGLNNCMESEITPAADFIAAEGVQYFETVMDQQVCAYGPWVSEKLHNFRPEIHPSEVLWYPIDKGHRVMLFQDASRRYDRKHRFAWLDCEPAQARTKVPWVSDTLEVELELAFQLANNQDNLKFELIVRDIADALLLDKRMKGLILVSRTKEGLSISTEGMDNQDVIRAESLSYCAEGEMMKGLLKLSLRIHKIEERFAYLVVDVIEI